MALERLAQPTSITMRGLYTQDVLGILLFHEVARVQRYPIPLTLLKIGVEYPNKSHVDFVEGAKRVMAHVLSANLRAVDAAGQYGQDYLVIMPVTDGANGLAAARRLTKLLFNTHPIRNGHQLELTTFIGLATLAEHTTITVEDFIARTTRALAEARKRAPGSIVAYGELP